MSKKAYKKEIEKRRCFYYFRWNKEEKKFDVVVTPYLKKRV